MAFADAGLASHLRDTPHLVLIGFVDEALPEIVSWLDDTL